MHWFVSIDNRIKYDIHHKFGLLVNMKLKLNRNY